MPHAAGAAKMALREATGTGTGGVRIGSYGGLYESSLETICREDQPQSY
jgi:hypothetical protein